jgi:hypothetical protein
MTLIKRAINPLKMMPLALKWRVVANRNLSSVSFVQNRNYHKNDIRRYLTPLERTILSADISRVNGYEWLDRDSYRFICKHLGTFRLF